MTFLLRLLGLDGGTNVQSIVDHAWRVMEPASRWVLAVLAAIGLLLALINFLPKLRIRWTVRLMSFLLRLGMTALLVLVLVHVELQLRLKVWEKQHWVVLADDSGSMATKDEGGHSRFEAAMGDLEKVRQVAGDDVWLDVQTLSGQKLADQPGKGPTYISKAVSRCSLSTSGVDRLIFLTDGRDTENRDLSRLGGDLKARNIDLGIRVYGQTGLPVEAGIFAEPQRPLIRLGENLVVQGSIAKGSKTVSAYHVMLQEDGNSVKEAEIPAEQARQFVMSYKPPASGSHRYTLSLPPAESSALNSSYSFKANVVEDKIKVLMIEGFPTYEYKLMKVALEVDPMVALTAITHLPGGGVYVQGKPLHSNPEAGLVSSEGDLFRYDIVVLLNLSRQYFRAGGDTGEGRLRDIVEFVTKRGGGLMVNGGSDVYRAGGYENTPLADILPFDLSDAFGKEAQFDGKFFVAIPKAAYLHPVVRMYDDPKRSKERLDSLPQLDGSNNVGRFKPLATPLMTRTVKLKDASGELTDREVPILAYQPVGDGKVIAAAVDTMWKWQLQPDFEDPPLAQLLANIVRFIAPPPRLNPGAPDVKIAARSLQVGQEAVLYTTLKDKNFDPIRNADLTVTVKGPDGTVQMMYPRDLPEQPGRYEYRIGLDMPGPYDVKAVFGKEQYQTSFLVEASAGELADCSADPAAMKSFADAAGGQVISSMDEWLRRAAHEGHTHLAARDLQVWNSPLILILFTVLLCADCFIRKRQGLA